MFIGDDFKFLELKLRKNKNNCWGGSITGTDLNGKDHLISCEVEMYSPLAASRYLLAKLEHLWYVQNNPEALDADELDPDREEEEPEDFEQESDGY